MMSHGARGKTRRRLILAGVAIGLSVGLSVGLPLGVPLGLTGSVGSVSPAFAGEDTFLFDVVTLTGRKSSLVGYGSMSIDNVKARIQNNWGIPPDQQQLMFAGRQLLDGKTLDFYGITNGATLHLFLKLRGSPTPTPEPTPQPTPEERVLPDTGQNVVQAGILFGGSVLLTAIGAALITRRRVAR